MRYIIKHISFHEYRQRRAPRASKVSSNLISVHFTLLFSVIRFRMMVSRSSAIEEAETEAPMAEKAANAMAVYFTIV